MIRQIFVLYKSDFSKTTDKKKKKKKSGLENVAQWKLLQVVCNTDMYIIFRWNKR